ncbi:diguanylate cyclase [Hydrogenimonas sp.]
MQELRILPVKVVYVEDDDEIRDATASYLEGYVEELHVAKNGKEGFELFTETNPDVVVTDIEMPVMNGLEMIRKIKRVGANTPIFVTATFETDTLPLTEAIKNGIAGYLYKKSEPSELLRSIHDHFQLIHTSFLTFTLSPEGIILSVSEAFGKFLGYETTELLSRHVSSFIVPLNVANVLHFLKRLDTTGQMENIQTIFRKRNGAEIILSGSGRTIRDPRRGTHYEFHWYPLDCILRSNREIQERLERECYLKSLLQLHTYISQEAIRSYDTEIFIQEIMDRLPAVDPDITGALLNTQRGLEVEFFTKNASIDYPALFPGFHDVREEKEETKYLPHLLSARYNQIAFVDDISHLPDSPFKKRLKEKGIVTILSIPMDNTSRSKRSVLTVMFGHRHRFDKEELDLWQNITKTMGFGIESIHLKLERDALIRRLDTIAHTDTLTGVINRYRGIELLESEIQRARRYEKVFSIVFFDIDNFKKINDTYGHITGDKVLIKVSEIVGSSLRSTDALIRWGGEEFLVLLPETSLHDAVHLAQKLRRLIEQRDSEIPLPVTASFGVTEWDREHSLDILISRADSKMYEAKRQGRNRIAY